MLEEFVRELREVYSSVISGAGEDRLAVFKEKWEIDGSVGEKYEVLRKRGMKKKTGSFYTPGGIVEFMVKQAVDNVDYKVEKYFKILDPSCGGGFFLIEVIKKLSLKAEAAGIKNSLKFVIENNIFGYDIDETAVMISVLEIYDLSGVICGNIKVGDFLISSEDKFDVIIGNPPYIGHKVLTGEYRKKLSENFGEVFADKADISYCFIKKSIDSLRDKGRLMFLTSRYILEALNGASIRNYIKHSGRINKLIDFYGIRFIKGAGIDNIILDFSKDNSEVSKGQIDFYRFKEEAKGKGILVFEDIDRRENIYTDNFLVNQARLQNSGWLLLKSTEANILKKINGYPLSSYCESYQGIITGCDEAFVLDADDERVNMVDEKLLKPWIKGKAVKQYRVDKTKQFLIYSNNIEDEELYNKTLKIISKCRERLERRRECKRGVRRWYELQWGRRPEIFEGEKLIFPYKSAENRFAIDKDNYFSADIYALKIKDNQKMNMSYAYLAGVLNSRIYEFYIKLIAKKLGDDLYEYYPNKIMTLKVPERNKEIEAIVLSGEDEMRDKIDRVLLEYFKITSDEYKVIKEWCKN